MSPVISGGRIITGGTVIAGAKRRIAWFDTFATGAGSDAKYAGGGDTPANGALAGDLSNGNIYQRTAANTWGRIDTL